MVNLSCIISFLCPSSIRRFRFVVLFPLVSAGPGSVFFPFHCDIFPLIIITHKLSGLVFIFHCLQSTSILSASSLSLISFCSPLLFSSYRFCFPLHRLSSPPTLQLRYPIPSTSPIHEFFALYPSAQPCTILSVTSIHGASSSILDTLHNHTTYIIIDD